VSAGRDEHRAIKRAYRTVRGSEADANRALASLVTEVGHGDRVPSSTDRGRAVTDLVVDFLTHLQQDKGRKHSTLVRYRGLLSVWIQPAIGGLRLEQVRPTDIERLLGRMRREGQSRSSIHQTRTLLKGAFRWARRNRWVSQDPIIDIEVPPSTKPAREVVPPDIESLLRLLAAALEEDLVFGAACYVGAATGLRRGESCGLQWARVDLERRSLLVERTVNDAGGKLVIDDFTKTRRARWVGFDEHTAKLLTRLHDQHRYHAQAQGLAPSLDAFVFTHAPDGSAPFGPNT
jgi:integrase